ncbi:MAG: hypothetical protein AAFY20_03265 [Cyanobacteria bacterium J06639_14]
MAELIWHTPAIFPTFHPPTRTLFPREFDADPVFADSPPASQLRAQQENSLK